MDIADQYDWMVGTEAYTVSDKTPSADVVQAHAQTAHNINVVRDAAYTGEGLVEALAITSEGLASEGTLDTRDGSWSAINGANTAISIISAPFILDGTTLTNQENPYMFVPASDDTKDFTVSATIDGKPYNTTVTMNEPFMSGKMYQVNVKVTNTGLVVSKVSLVDWTTELLPDTMFEPVKDNTVSYDNYITIVYQVTEESLDIPHSIFRFEYEGSEYNTDLALIQEMKIDGNNVEPVYEYKFENTGEHIVQVLLKNNTEIPENFIFAIIGVR